MTNIKILCVDDQPANLVALDAALASTGYTLVHAGSGMDALYEITRHDFAAILLDVQMPEMDGFQTADAIRNIHGGKSIPIIFLTAIYPDDDYALMGYEAGAFDYLFKPLNPNVLRAKIAVFVELHQKNIELKKQSMLLRDIERRTQERKYQNLVEGIREGIVWAADVATYRCTYVSPHSEKITGYPVGDWFQDRSFLERCLPYEEYTRFAKFLKSEVLRKKRSWIEHAFIKANGERIWLRTEVHVEEDAAGTPTEYRGLSIDITSLKEVEVSLREAVIMKDNAIKLREDFLSIAAHELKTPITPLQLQMQSFIRLIEKGKLDSVPVEKLKAMLEISDSQVFRLSRLISQLLDASKLREGRLAIRPESCDLPSLIENVLKQIHYEFEAADCRVDTDLQPMQVQADPFRLEQVLVNLLINATKYAPGSPIRIELKKDSKNAFISVEDQGIGIARVDQERIFGRFERAVSAKNFGGLGLGLYISKEIVELHRGTIQVESELNRGSKFKIALPL